MAVRKPSQPAASLLLRPFQYLFAKEAAGSILLLLCTAAALIWANSPVAESYHHLWETYVGLGVGEFELRMSLHHWINDGLMAVFFFVIGLEIKREVLVGELATMRKAALPLVAAVGGMVVPALLYAGLNAGTAEISGWGVPMATDIAC
jgi:NhaA family Na+:H+ antiporter